MIRKYISVITLFDLSGNITPLFVVLNNGIKYKIDKILHKCPAASLKSGGSGIRYTCLFNNQIRYLFLDNNKWFIEKVS